MTIISLLLFKYALFFLALYGFVESIISIRIAMGDMRVLAENGVNGPKKLSTLMRIHQAGFLLSVFGVLLLLGAIMLLSPMQPLAFYTVPTVLANRIGLVIVTVLLIFKQVTSRKNRARLDDYYDRQHKEMLYMHRRATDPPYTGDPR